MINKRLSNISCDNNEFEKHKETYAQALAKSGYKQSLFYSKITNRNKSNVEKEKLFGSTHRTRKMCIRMWAGNFLRY